MWVCCWLHVDEKNLWPGVNPFARFSPADPLSCSSVVSLWERSLASKTIKHMMGNPDALASAYSLYDYAIASDLGGEPPWQNLRDRAARRGIRGGARVTVEAEGGESGEFWEAFESGEA